MTKTIVSARWRFDGALAFALGAWRPSGPAPAANQVLAFFAGFALYIVAALLLLVDPGPQGPGLLLGMATLAKLDRAYETSTTVGVGALTLAGAIAGHQTVATAAGAGNYVPYFL